MKLYRCFISAFVLLVLLASCSRQVTSFRTTSRLQTALLPADKQETKNVVSSIAPVEKPESVIQCTAPAIEVVCADSKTSPIIKKHIVISRFAKDEAKAVKAVVSHNVASLLFTQKPAAERDYPQINKAGFILIAGGLLGLLLHLILIACIILIAIGLVILISPLFRKRY